MIYVIPTETAEPLIVEDLTAALGKDFARQDFARQGHLIFYRPD